MKPARLRWTIATCIAALTLGQSAIAQITPDETLGSERSRVVRDVRFNDQPLVLVINGVANPVDVIAGGARRGSTLFHSFSQFSPEVDRATYFFTPGDSVQNIVGRVTGSAPSVINSRIGVLEVSNGNPFRGSANLFLINPNGILFGEKASLDVDGAFVATTANAVQFGDNSFSASTPQAAPDVLTVNPSAFLFNRIPTGNITVRSNTPIDPGSRFAGLTVQNNQNLILLGGNVTLEGGQIGAFGGRVEIGAVAGTGVVGLNPNGSLTIPTGVERGEVQFSQAAKVDVSLVEQGNISITANNIRFTDQSQLIAGVDDTGGSLDSQAGDIVLNATGSIDLTGGSRIQNDVNRGFTGNSGDINITANTLSLSEDSQISASTVGTGDAGNINITVADRVLVRDPTLDGPVRSAILTRVEAGGIGNGGNLSVSANTLELGNGAQLSASTLGEGAAGNVTIRVRDRVSLDVTSGIFSSVGTNAVGNGGNLFVSANTLELLNGGQLIASTNGRGNAGNVTVEVGDGIVIRDLTGDLNSAIFSQVQTEGVGAGGNVQLTANTLELSGGGRINASTLGQGNAGNVRVEVRDRVSLTGSQTAIFSSVETDAVGNGGSLFVSANTLELLNGGQLVAATEGRGDAGSVTATIGDRIVIRGSEGDLNSTIFSRVGANGVGAGGNVQISANTVELSDGGRVNASTLGEGNAGNVTIRVRDRVSLTGSQTAIFSNVADDAVGNGGNLFISARTLELLNGSQLVGSTSGRGNAGSVTVDVRDRVTIRGTEQDVRSNISSQVNSNGVGNGGNVEIAATTLELSDEGRVSASTLGQGNAGNVTIRVRDRVSLTGGETAIFSNVETRAVGNGGNLFVSANTLELLNGAQLVASTDGRGNAGNVRVEVGDGIAIGGSSGDLNSTIFSQVRSNGVGTGGNVQISANTLALGEGGRINVSTLGQGDAGNVRVEVRDRVSMIGNSVIFSSVDTGAVGNGGNVFISANTLELLNGGQLVASTFGQGDAGNVRVEVRDRVSLIGAPSTIFGSVESGAVGNGGNLFVSANTLELLDGGQLITSTRGTGNAGNVTVDLRDRMLIRGTSENFNSAIFSRVESGGVGTGGNVQIFANTLELLDGGQLAGSTSGRGNAGNIFLGAIDRPIGSVSITGTTAVTGRSSALFVFTESDGTGGNIRIFADRFRLSDGGVVDARTFGARDSGTIAIDANTIDILRGGQILAVTQGSGRADSITINARDRVFLSGTDPSYADRLAQFGTNVAPISSESGIYTRSRGNQNAGSAGSIFLTAPRIELDDRARIDAQSTAVDGGNITLRASDRLVLRNNSQITATAGTAEGFGDGGNIDIDARFIIAIPKENSDITANAFRGTGGRVTLNVSEGVLGIEARSQPTGLSDITASSAQGTTGIVTLNTPDTNSLQNSLSQLSQREINTNELLANSCIVRDRQNGSFYITGTGGLPTKPTELSDYPTGTIQPPVTPERTESIVEPQGIYQLPNGKLVMVRNCPN
ncbi:filamentous haemagglutinin outer membrane protein [Leptolyngbya sp. NIES-3755]|nr:filamentous haemagglutinin outer membrane protein [Leptolyngbya sp. NIES-3755]